MSQPPDEPQPEQPSWGQPPPPGWGAPTPGPGGPANYSPTDAIGYGWKMFQRNAGPLVTVALILVVGSIAINLLVGVIFGGSVVSYDLDDGIEFNPLVLVGNAISSLVSLILSAAAIRVALDVVEGRGVDLGAMFSRFDLVQVIVAGILVSIATTIGLLLCVLPGIVIAFLAAFTNYFIIGKGEDAVTAIKSSFRFVLDNLGPVLLFALLGFVCMMAGALACLVGTLVAVPVVLIAGAYTFRVLNDKPVAQP